MKVDQLLSQNTLATAKIAHACTQAQPALRSCHYAQRPLLHSLPHSSASAAAALRQQGNGRPRVCVSAAAVEYGQLGDLGVPQESYVVLGLAHCFEKNDEGKLSNRMVIEPIAANALECMVLGAKTCFKAATGLVLSDALSRDKARLPEEFRDAAWCPDFEFRCGATARTWLRPHAQDNLLDLVPLGQTRSKFNFNLDEKRVLNFENEVSDADNIKQDMSIDVYGRKSEEEPAPAPTAQAAAEPSPPQAGGDEDDDLDALLSS